MPKKLADAILGADLHIRPGKPQSRIDDFQKAMWTKFEFILSLSVENDFCPILFAGDLGQESEWPNWLLRKFLSTLLKASPLKPIELIVIPGQHDLPNHNLSLWKKSGLGVLEIKDSITLLYSDNQNHTDLTRFTFSGHSKYNQFYIHPFPYGQPIKNCLQCKQKGRQFYSVAMAHDLILAKEGRGWEQGKGLNGISLLKQFPEYDLILTGDNHKSFVLEHQGRLLVNPGSMMRSAADQIDHQPRVYLWYADEKRVEIAYLPIEKEVLSRERIEKQEEKERRMQAFVESIKPGEIKIKFEENMKIHLRENPASPEVEQKIWDCFN
jgi:DNA repair exonuclease SbcCD nuclease subunit